MPINPKYSNSELLDNFNAAKHNVNLQASLSKNFKTEADKQEINQIYKLIYGKDRINTFSEKETIANQFFADLIDGNSINWMIYQNGQRVKKLEKLLVKYLQKTNFALKLWQTKFKSGIYGNYGMVILKELTGEKTEAGLNRSIPNLIPVRIIYKNSINDKLFDVEVEFEGYNFSNGKTLFTLHRRYSLLDNQLSIDKSLIDLKSRKKVDDDDLTDSLRTNLNLTTESFDWPFIPVSVMINNYDEIPRIHQVQSRMELLNQYDETLAILPAWEKGSINFNGKPVTAQNQPLQNMTFMKNILFTGFNEFKPVEVDGSLMNLTENLVILKPNSIMKTTKATRDLIWTEIKEDLGLPSLNEVKSAQKTSLEILAKQFLISPIIEREKNFVKNFLKDLAKKFLAILSECEIPEKIGNVDLNNLEIDLDFDLTTEKNINETVKQMAGEKLNAPEQTIKQDLESKLENKALEEPESEKKFDVKPSIWRRILEWFRNWR